MEKACKICGKKFFKGKGYSKKTWKKAKFCSVKCYSEYKRDHKAQFWKRVIEKSITANTKPWEKLSYNGKHKRIRQNWGIPGKCELCGRDNLKNNKIGWMNKDHTYKQNREDWMRACRSCHAKYDIEHNLVDFRPMRNRK